MTARTVRTHKPGILS